MEARTKQQQLLFDKGITNVPSDNLCSDNTLAESVGMVYEDGEHRVIQRPVEFITSGLENGKKLLYIHKRNNYDNFIIRDGDSIKWGTRNASKEYVPAQSGGSDIVLMTASGDAQITSIGNTLIVTDENGIKHFKWNGSGYKYIAYPIPDIHFEAKLVNSQNGIFASNSGSLEGIIESEQDPDTTDIIFNIVGGSREDYNNLVTGLYAKNLKTIAKEKGFTEPFFVRAALEMYDGSYTYITNPILLFPAIQENTKFFVLREFFSIAPAELVAVTQELRLYIRQTTDFTEYSDIVKDVVVFVSQGVNIYNTVTDQPLENKRPQRSGSDIEIDWTVGDNISSLETNETGRLTKSEYKETEYNTNHYSPPENMVWSWTTIRGLEKREEKSIVDDIEGTSVFYKIASLGLKDIRGFVDIGEKTTSEVTENLTTQEYLEYDDYYSRCALIPNYTYVYNSRLNMANVNRGFFDGFGYFMPLDQDGASKYYFDVTIKTDIGEKTVRHIEQRTEGPSQMQGLYFYYPDSRATHVVIYKAGPPNKKILDTDLKEHPGLNGAYYFAGLPDENTTEPSGETIGDIPAVTDPDSEYLYNYIIQSEVNNPWVFLSTGYHAVGTGEVIAISTVTHALSEGQFGGFPLLVFSENGIWAMAVNGTGLYETIKPMSREICNNKKSITQTDGAVFFTSEKGLMVIVGNREESGFQVKCVSEQLSGKQDLYSDAMFPSSVIGNVSNFFRTCYIAYDYRDSLLWIMGNAPGAEHCYIYSIKSGTFSKYHLPQLPRGCVNYYPDYLIQTNPSGKVYSLLQRPNINLDYVGETTNPRQYTATMLTRPMKMENALALKSIMHLKNIKLFSPYTITENDEETPHRASITTRIFASNDLENWVERTSLRGVPFKYYRFRFDFADLIATDRFAGTVVVTQERRTDKIR